MNTDSLSEEAYNAVIVAAEKFHHDLASQFGVLAGDCKNENEYLQKSRKLIKHWNRDMMYVIEDIFFKDIPEVEEFKAMLETLLENIAAVEKIPVDIRHFDE